MAEPTVRLSIYHLTVDEANEIFKAAIHITQRNLSSTMYVEVLRRTEGSLDD